MIFWAGSAWQRHTPQHTNSTQHTDNKTLTTGERDKRQRTETETRTEGQRGGKEDGYGCCSCYLLSYWLTDLLTYCYFLLLLPPLPLLPQVLLLLLQIFAVQLRYYTDTLLHLILIFIRLRLSLKLLNYYSVSVRSSGLVFLGAVSQINLRTRSPAKRLPLI